MKCNSCNQEKEEYVPGLCKECSDKMDKHIDKYFKDTETSEKENI